MVMISIPNTKEEEKRAIRAFCTQHPCAEILELRDEPDAIVRVNGRVWGIEIVGYHSDDPRKQVETLHLELRNAISEAWAARPDMWNMRTSYFYYISKWKKQKGKNAMKEHFLVPPRNQHDEAIQELLRLATDMRQYLAARAKSNTPYQRVIFTDSFDAVGELQGHVILPRKHWPLLGRHFRNIGLRQRDASLGSPRLPNSNLAAGGRAPDCDEIKKFVGGKSQKVAGYRTNVPNHPIGLLIQEAGWPFSARAAVPEQLPQAFAAVLKAHDAAEHKFNAIWWLRFGLSEPEKAELYEIVPPVTAHS